MAYARGDAVENPPESLRLFALCEAMGFNHLPVHGGLYDQHPDLLAEWEVIFNVKGREERRRAEKKQKDMERKARVK